MTIYQIINTSTKGLWPERMKKNHTDMMQYSSSNAIGDMGPAPTSRLQLEGDDVFRLASSERIKLEPSCKPARSITQGSLSSVKHAQELFKQILIFKGKCALTHHPFARNTAYRMHSATTTISTR